jgi:hypothetical protein
VTQAHDEHDDDHDDRTPVSEPGEEAHHRRRPHPPRGWGADLERSRPGARYGLVLLLLLVTFVFMASGPTGDWVPLVTAILQGATLLFALAASESGRRMIRLSIVLVAMAVAAGAAVLVTGGHEARGYSNILSVFLIGVAPFAIAGYLLRRRVIDVHTVLGAVCIYVFIGMFFAFIFSAIGELGDQPFFAQQRSASLADYLYFSFVTLTTVGYGDLSARGGLGRATAVLDALLGQIYLVTVLALLVSQLGRRSRPLDGG